jgi:2-amino-4-hydroxy-6-hydroxymethyldihydropteridine diphosphokinase
MAVPAAQTAATAVKLQRDAVLATIGLGANLGDAVSTLQRAIQCLADTPGLTLAAVSAMYGSAPVDSDGADYVNAVVQVHTRLNAMALLAQLQAHEQQAGRTRPYRNAPRTLDLDLLLYGQATIQSPTLTVPHPRMHQRAFVLLPLADMAPQWADAAHAVAALPGQRVWRLESSARALT